MPNSSNPLNVVAALMVMAFAPAALWLGAAGALSDTGPMRPIFMLLFAAGLMMLFGGVQTILRWRRARDAEADHRRAIRAAVTQPLEPRRPSASPAVCMAPRPAPVFGERPADVQTARPSGTVAERAPEAASPSADAVRVLDSGEPVLAHWTYAADEWSAYTRSEWRGRVAEAVGLGIGIFLLGWLIGRGEMGDGAIIFGLMFGLLFFIGKLVVAGSAKQANESGPGEAIITPTAVVLNGKYHVLADENFRFEGVRYDTAALPPVLEFRIGWKTRGGRTHDEVRVPVPAGREDEARAVVAAFEHVRAVQGQA